MLNPNDMVRVSRFIVVETGTYNPMFHRSYQSNIDHETHQDILRRIDVGQTLTAAAFSDIASRIIQPSSHIGRDVGIVGGFAMRRARFFLELDWMNNLGSHKQILTGYTDPIDSTYAGRVLSPTTQLYINNTMMFRLQTDHTGTRLVPVSGGHVLVDENYSGIYGGPPRHLTRPMDVVMHSALGHHDTEAIRRLGQPKDPLEFGSAGQPAPVSPALISSSCITHDSKLSARSNSNPASFVARVFESDRRATSENTDYGQSREDTVMSAQRFAADTAARNDRFLSALRNISGTTHYGNTFTLNDLLRLDPNATNPALFRQITLEELSRKTASDNRVWLRPHHTGQTHHLNGSDMNTRIAVLLANAIPGIMADCALTKTSISYTNRDGGGIFKGGLSHLESFMSGMSLEQLGRSFESRVLNELIVASSMNHEILLEVSVHSDLLGDTHLDILVNNERYSYCVPTFCDAIYTPVIQDSIQNLQTIATQFGNVMNEAQIFAASRYAPQGQPVDYVQDMGGVSVYGSQPHVTPGYSGSSLPSDLDSIADGI